MKFSLGRMQRKHVLAFRSQATNKKIENHGNMIKKYIKHSERSSFIFEHNIRKKQV